MNVEVLMTPHRALMVASNGSETQVFDWLEDADSVIDFLVYHVGEATSDEFSYLAGCESLL
ncbi:unnamed protein product [marine sediment metagenome]|uniref:Uncharacterized protein n=1 Tax=marine sediment metagenome TaxID=412755 RepID=X0WLE7_9ZZZZ